MALTLIKSSHRKASGCSWRFQRWHFILLIFMSILNHSPVAALPLNEPFIAKTRTQDGGGVKNPSNLKQRGTLHQKLKGRWSITPSLEQSSIFDRILEISTSSLGKGISTVDADGFERVALKLKKFGRGGIVDYQLFDTNGNELPGNKTPQGILIGNILVIEEQRLGASHTYLLQFNNRFTGGTGLFILDRSLDCGNDTEIDITQQTNFDCTLYDAELDPSSLGVVPLTFSKR